MHQFIKQILPREGRVDRVLMDTLCSSFKNPAGVAHYHIRILGNNLFIQQLYGPFGNIIVAIQMNDIFSAFMYCFYLSADQSGRNSGCTPLSPEGADRYQPRVKP